MNVDLKDVQIAKAGPDSAPKTPISLEGLPADAFRHPLDVAAVQALEHTPGFSSVVEFVSKNFSERMIHITSAGQYVLVGPNQYPNLYRRFCRLASTLDVRRLPALYIEQDQMVNASARGVDKYTIRVTTGLINKMTEAEVDAILAHELGHVKCDHVKYRTIAYILSNLGGEVISMLPIPGTNLVMTGIELALLDWYRKAEFSCDRAALLAVQDLGVVRTALAKLAGTVDGSSESINIDALIDQAAAWDDIGAKSFIEKAFKLWVMRNETHPFPVIRVREISRWAETDQYQSILRRDYQSAISGENSATQDCLDPRVRICDSCGGSMPADAVFCAGCGTNLRQTAVVCGSCRHTVEDSWVVCPDCGRQLKGE